MAEIRDHGQVHTPGVWLGSLSCTHHPEHQSGGHLCSPPLVGNRGPETGRKSPQITQQDGSNLVAQTGLPRAYPELSSAFSRSWRGSGHSSPHYPGNEAPSLPRPTPSLAEEKPGLPHVWGCSMLLVTSSQTHIPWLRSSKPRASFLFLYQPECLGISFASLEFSSAVGETIDPP